VTLDFAVSEYRRLADGYIDQDGSIDAGRMFREDRDRSNYYFVIKTAIMRCLQKDRSDIPQELIDSLLRSHQTIR
jgi:hypothetical protein